jgi:hypothetical protein
MGDMVAALHSRVRNTVGDAPEFSGPVGGISPGLNQPSSRDYECKRRPATKTGSLGMDVVTV